jgi:hypothetical protein
VPIADNKGLNHPRLVDGASPPKKASSGRCRFATSKPTPGGHFSPRGTLKAIDERQPAPDAHARFTSTH